MAVEAKPSGRKSKSQFIHAALDILATRGSVKALTIDNLCQRLEISKGSFYWHFKGRSELIKATIEFWSDEFQKNVHQCIRDGARNEPRTVFKELVQFWLNSNFARIDQVMRSWGRQEVAVARAVQQADLQLLGFVSQLFEDMGYDKLEAQQRARLAIAVGVAEPQLSHLPHPHSQAHAADWVSSLILS